MTAEPILTDEVDEFAADDEDSAGDDPKVFLYQARLDRAIADADASARVLAHKLQAKEATSG